MDIIKFIQQFGEYGVVGIFLIIFLYAIIKGLTILQDQFNQRIEDAKLFTKITEQNTASNFKLAETMAQRNEVTDRLAIAVEKQTDVIDRMSKRQESYEPLVADLKNYIEERRKSDHERRNKEAARLAELEKELRRKRDARGE